MSHLTELSKVTNDSKFIDDIQNDFTCLRC